MDKAVEEVRLVIVSKNKWQNKNLIQHPATLLNQRRWEADTPPLPPVGAPIRAPSVKPDPLAGLKARIAAAKAEEEAIANG